MNQAVEKTESLWMATKKMPSKPSLAADAVADVCVIGSGIGGLSTAYLLAKEGRSVIVLDDGPVSGGQSQRTTAHLSNAIDDRFFEVERVHGEEGSRIAAESHSAAINQIETNVRTLGIECDFTRLDGYLFALPDDSDTLDREWKAVHRAGLKDV